MFMSPEKQQSICSAQDLLRQAGYQFRLYGKWDWWYPQYRKPGGEWENIPDAIEQFDWKAEQQLEQFQVTLAATL